MGNIKTPYDRVFIKTDEEITLPEKQALIGRLEKFLYVLCCLDYDNIPTPLSRIEEFANALITGTIPNIEPQSRSEQFFLAILDGDTNNLPEPQSRSEVLLNKLAIGDFDLSDIEPIQSRYELLLTYLIKNGGIGNLDYVFYTFASENETLYNTKERPVKSAILKGQTLVNCISFEISANQENRYITYYKESVPLIGGKKYLIYLPNFNDLTLNVDIYTSSTKQWKRIITCNSKVVVFQAQDDEYIRNCFGYISSNHVSIEPTKNMMVLEYQEGMENWDIPYFEGMKSVKMPVLKTVGKNLFDGKLEVGLFSGSNGNKIPHENFVRSSNYIRVNSDKITYTVVDEDCGLSLLFYDDTKNFISQMSILSTKATMSLPENTKYVRFRSYMTGVPASHPSLNNLEMRVQIEEGSASTPYEPYKSNILTVNEDVELRGVGEVKDELNLLTGEITRRIGELVLDGSEDETITLPSEYTNTIRYTISTKDAKTRAKGISSAFIYEMSDNDNEHFRFDGGKIGSIMLYVSKTTATNVDELRTWLSNNPLTINYELGAETIEEVNPTAKDQDGNEAELSSFEDITYVTVSSEGLIPEVTLEVATKIEEVLNTMSLEMDDISTTQNTLEETSNAQSENIDSTMIATTEIYEQLL